jgi:hypothetical protein
MQNDGYTLDDKRKLTKAIYRILSNNTIIDLQKQVQKP